MSGADVGSDAVLVRERHGNVGAEVIEMMGFAEELGEIGRNRVDEAFQFSEVRCQVFPILPKRGQAKAAQAA